MTVKTTKQVNTPFSVKDKILGMKEQSGLIMVPFEVVQIVEKPAELLSVEIKSKNITFFINKSGVWEARVRTYGANVVNPGWNSDKIFEKIAENPGKFTLIRKVRLLADNKTEHVIETPITDLL